MHPEIRLPEPGLCPKCNMDLIPLDDTGGQVHEHALTLSEAAVALADIQTSVARRLEVAQEIHLVGVADYDERYRKTISAWIAGRLDDLHADFTGTRVEAGDHLVDLYSPDLIVAQQEILSAYKRRNDGDMAARVYTSSREKLRLWGLEQEQIDEIVERGTIADHITIKAPVGGLVTHRHVSQGQYVMTGQPLFDIADPSRLWVVMEAYESDLAHLFIGQPVSIQADALPGEPFSGTVAFIHPEVDEHTRTLKVRVNVPNPAGRLKPGMYTRSTIRVSLNADGHARRPDLSGKWVSPMHPEIIKEGPGSCDICGMDLVAAESLGLGGTAPVTTPLVIPSTAVLLTGRRAVVYIQVPDAGKPTFEGREVLLGPRAGDHYVVLEGLDEGDRVVTRGNFKIDSALQIEARSSMMNDGDAEPEGSEGSEGSGGHE